MKTNILTLAITLTVGIILAGSLLVPVISDSTNAHLTYTNEGMPFAEVDDETHIITVSSAAITVDGETIDQSLFPGDFESYTIVYGSPRFTRMEMSSEAVRVCLSGNVYTFPYDNGETITITITNGAATVSSSNTGVPSRDMGDVLYYIAKEGNHVLSLNPYISNETIMYGAGGTYFTEGLPGGLNAYVSWYGTMDSISGTPFQYSSAYTLSVDSIEPNTTEMAKDLYRVDSVLVTFDALYKSTEEHYPVTSTYTYFLVPKEIVYDDPAYLGDGAAALLGALPILVIVGLLLAAVGAIYTKRDD